MRPIRQIIGTLLTVFLFLVAASNAQQHVSPTPQRDSTGISLIGQSLAAMGLVASPTLRTLAQGTITYADGQAQPLKIETAGVDRVRNDVGVNDFTFVTNSGAGFLVLDGTRQKLQAWMTAYKRADHLPSLSLMTEYLNPNLQVVDVGLENVAGSQAHHLRLSMWIADPTWAQAEDLISEFHVWIDPVSLSVVKTRTFNFSPHALQNRSPIETLYSDYRQQQGALVPFHLTRYEGNQKESDIVFSSISLNATVADSDFQ